MTYKTHIDRLPIPPKDASVQNVTCQFCIVGCGYHAISWPVDRQGRPKPGENAFGADLTEQRAAMTPNGFAPSMHNIVRQNGRDVHLLIKPDANCAVSRAARDAIMVAIREGGLFVVDVDIMPTQIGSCAHVMLPAATAGEAHLTSMNGERRMRLTERYMDPPGPALPDSLIVAKLAQA